ncbi:GUN4 domain-containing protein [Nostoc sp.]|uniref:GUN4 domain-containing protein n=1 Tax=Nostoc sp. TaxID=1180 RepID=UPI002FF5A1F9
MKETLAVILKASSREKESWFDDESINNFPCTDLRTINQLWVKYSDGRFGFSVQKKINLLYKADCYLEAWDKFCAHVGWKVKGNWIDYSNVAFNTSAPEGHLPFSGHGKALLQSGGLLSFLASRLGKCNI